MLTDAKCRRARCPDGRRFVKLTDGGGMFLLVTDAGGRYWRMNYRFGGKQKTLALGVYPVVPLAQAREKRARAKVLLRDGFDPALEMRRRAAHRFDAVAREWLEMRRPELADSTVRVVEMRLINDINPVIGHIGVDRIRAADVLGMLRAVCARGAVETAHRCRTIVGQILRYAIVTGRAESDPTPALRGAIQRPDARHMPAILDPELIGDMLRRIDAYAGTMVVRNALRLIIYTFVRPGELRLARWDEFDLAVAEWRIPAARMKMKDRGDHIVPLARQAVAVLREMAPVSGYAEMVFPGVRDARRPISNNTLNHALRRMGIGKDVQVAHGFRAVARTLLAEQGWNPEYIELQLAHAERNSVVAAYNRARHLPQRREMMQAWADYLDGLKQSG